MYYPCSKCFDFYKKSALTKGGWSEAMWEEETKYSFLHHPQVHNDDVDFCVDVEMSPVVSAFVKHGVPTRMSCQETDYERKHPFGNPYVCFHPKYLRNFYTWMDTVFPDMRYAVQVRLALEDVQVFFDRSYLNVLMERESE